VNIVTVNKDLNLVSFITIRGKQKLK